MRKASLVVLIFLASVVIYPSSLAVPETKVSVDPTKIEVKVNQTFTININITDVYELKGFDFRLSYDTAILELTKVEEGPFMKNVGNTLMINLTTKGLVWLAVVLYHPQGLDISASGNGILATITFKAIAIGECLLDLHSTDPCRPNEVKLARGCEVEHIPNVAFDGRVIVLCNSDPPDPPPDPPDPPPDPPAEKSPDINGDGKVDILDIHIVARAFGSKPNNPKWDERADLNNDQKVGINDLFILAKNFEA